MTDEANTQPQPPGDYLRELLEERHWTGTDLATVLGWAQSDVSNLLLRKKRLTPEIAVQLAAVFPQTTTQEWIDRESRFLISQSKDNHRDLNRRSQIFNNFPALEMMKRGWIEKTEDLNELEKQICDFFEIGSLDETPTMPHAAKKTGTYLEVSKKQIAWLRRARRIAPAIMVKKFTAASLSDGMDRLRQLLYDANDIRQVPKILAEAGVRLVIIESFPGGKIDGATFWLDDKSPVIVLSLRFDRIDSFWHSLFHELSHVKNGEGKDTPIIDVDLFGEDGPSEDKPDFEKRADEDAALSSISKDALDSFIRRTHPLYGDKKIQGFAALNKVHPGILVGQLHHRYSVTGNGLPFTHQRKFLVKIRSIILESAMADGYGYKPSI